MKNLFKDTWFRILIVVLALAVMAGCSKAGSSPKTDVAVTTEAAVAVQAVTEAPIATDTVVEPTPGTMKMEIVDSAPPPTIEKVLGYVFVDDQGGFTVSGDQISVVSATLKGVEVTSKEPKQDLPLICIPATSVVGSPETTAFECGFLVMK